MLHDPAADAVVGGALVLACLTAWTWPSLPYYPIEFSQMGWHSCGGYCIMAIGLPLALVPLLWHYVHVDTEPIAAAGVFCLMAMAIVNGDSSSDLRAAHSVIAMCGFLLCLIHIGTKRGGFTLTEWIAFAAIAVGHGITLLFLSRVDYLQLLQSGDIRAFAAKVQQAAPVWVLQVRGVAQYTMIAMMARGILSIPVTHSKPA